LESTETQFTPGPLNLLKKCGVRGEIVLSLWYILNNGLSDLKSNLKLKSNDLDAEKFKSKVRVRCSPPQPTRESGRTS